MTFRLSTVCSAVLIGHLHLLAIAQTEPAVPATPAAAASSVDTAASAPVAPATGKVVPKLTLKWDCGDCEHNEKVLPLIDEEYAKEAQAKGYAVSATESAELSIVEYRQRKPGMRVVFGLFAGKDILKTRIQFRGKEYVAEDYSANMLFGMNSLCKAVGQKAVEQLGPVAAAQ